MDVRIAPKGYPELRVRIRVAMMGHMVRWRSRCMRTSANYQGSIDMTTLSAGTKVLIFAALIAIAGCGELRSREDFVASIQDKSTTEVQATIGKPIAIDESAPDTIRWTYKSKTFSTESGTKFDKKTVVVFRKGEGSAPAKMVDVVYE